MRGLLVRVGIDATSGGWNAPAKPENRNFFYVPIPELGIARPSMLRSYHEIANGLAAFGTPLPAHLSTQAMHLDPDFEHMTYGDSGRRASQIRKLTAGDFLVFYAGMCTPFSTNANLVYGLIGIYFIKRIEEIISVEPAKWSANAHTRREFDETADDVIVSADSQSSGRLENYIPIGEYRHRAYRVIPEILTAWGGLSVKDGYLQRSAVLPSFSQPERFVEWFFNQSPKLRRGNWV